MATKLEALAIAVALLALAFSVGNPSSPEKTFVVSQKKNTSANACRRRIVTLNSQIVRVAEHALSSRYSCSSLATEFSFSSVLRRCSFNQNHSVEDFLTIFGRIINKRFRVKHHA